MPRIAVTLVALWTVCCSVVWQVEAASDAFVTPPYGPLRLVNQQPVQLLFLQPFPDRADVTPPGHLDVHLNMALTNTLIEQKRQDFTATLDLEMVRTVIDLHYGMRPHLEVGLELPLMYTYGGILDNFILDVEGVLTPRRERSLRQRQVAGGFTYQVLRPGSRPFIRGQDDAFGLGDVVLKAKAHLLREHERLPAVSLRAAVKFPSGDAQRAFGSGEIDGGFGLLVQKTLGRWTFYVNGDVTFPGQAFDDVEVSPFFSGVLAIEFRLARPLSLILQVRGDTRPFHNIIPILDKRLIETLLGVNWALSRRVVLQAGLAEDQFNSACCSADVSFFLNLSGRL